MLLRLLKSQKVTIDHQGIVHLDILKRYKQEVVVIGLVIRVVVIFHQTDRPLLLTAGFYT